MTLIHFPIVLFDWVDTVMKLTVKYHLQTGILPVFFFLAAKFKKWSMAYD